MEMNESKPTDEVSRNR